MTNLELFYDSITTAVREQDLTRIQNLVDPTFVIHYDGSLPFGGTYQGLAGFHEVVMKLTASMDNLVTEQLNYMEDANGEQYSLIISLTAKVGDRQVATQVSELWTVRAGKAVEARIWYWGAVDMFANADEEYFRIH
ncbi:MULTISPECIES: hypothetical protein [Actinomycetes]|uniref:nuclear transport factor 2 family protein n=1 Tax=Actinomycetes TaxID=1760 RepID=UPI0004C177C2|nr:MULTISPECIES: hypothetical protein [Actinomycetes]